MEILSSIYDFKTSIAIIEGKNYDKEIKAAVVYLVEHLYVNRTPFKEIKYPVMVKFWTKIEQDLPNLSPTIFEQAEKYQS